MRQGSASREADVTKQSFGPTVRTAQYYDVLMAHQDNFLHTLATRANARLVIPSAQQRFLEQNTITLPSVGATDATTNSVTSEQHRFLEQNTILPSVEIAPSIEAGTLVLGHDR